MQRLLAEARSWLTRTSAGAIAEPVVAEPPADETLEQRLLNGPGEVRKWLRSGAVVPTLGTLPPTFLRAAIVCLDASAPMWVVWGPERTLFYNDAAIPLFGAKHPTALGMPAPDTNTALWQSVGPAVEAVASSGLPRHLPELLLLLPSEESHEERYFEISLSPLIDGASISGVLCAAAEITGKVQSTRRRWTLNDLIARLAEAEDEDQAWKAAATALAANPADLPFAVLYRSNEIGQSACLAGVVGLSSRSRRAPARIELADDDAVWPLAHAAQLGAPIRWSDALVCPLLPHGGKQCGYLIAGLNPRIAQDGEYFEFIELAAARISAGITFARAREEQTRREHTLERTRKRLEQRSIELTRLFEHAPIPILVVRGTESVLEMANPAALAASGGRAESGRALFDALPELAVYGDRLRLVIETGMPDVGREVVVRHEREGRTEERYFTFIAARLGDEAGEEAQVVIVATDVTEQVHARTALEASEARYRGIFESVDVSIWEEDFTGTLPLLDELGLTDADELRAHFERHPELLRSVLREVRVTDVNAATLRLLGANDKDEVIRSMPRIFLPETWRAFAKKLVAIYTNQPFAPFDTAALNLAGERLELLMSVVGASRQADAGRVLLTLTDITVHKRLEQALREADRNKDEFLATLAHELRNPLAPLRSSVDLLRTRPGATPESILDIIERQVEHLARLANDLFETSRIRLGTYDVRKERVALNDVLRDAIETSQTLLERAGHELVTEWPDEPLWLDGDPVRLAQIFTNLLNNAARYTTEPGRIVLRAGRRDDAVEVAVIDPGIGIPAEALPQLFKIFSRLDAGESAADSGGLGIGLALARQLAEMHGGTIEAHSEGEGKGSTFVVRLPLARPKPGGQIDVELPEETITGHRILIVEDDSDAAESLRMLLEANDAEVRVAADGPKALSTFAGFEPDVVLLDIGLPGMNGFEVARRLRAEFPTPRFLIVALTGWSREEDLRRAREAGIDDHLVKPIDIAALRRILASKAKVRFEAPNGSSGTTM